MPVDIQTRLFAIRGLSPEAPAEPVTQDITGVKKGGYIDIGGVTYQVTDLYRYLDVKWSNFKRRKSDHWVTELRLLNLLSGEATFIEWEVDDELEVSQTEEQLLMRNILFDGSPITRANLEAIAEEEYGTVTVNGATYHYSEDDTWAGLFHREGDAEPLKVRCYEFDGESRGGKQLSLTIELWEEEESKPEREAFLSSELPPNNVKVIQLSASDNSGVAA